MFKYSCKKFVWSHKNMLREGVANKKNCTIHESWVEKNLESALFHQLFTLNYQYFNKVTQQQDTWSKKWAIVPTSSYSHQNIVINNQIFYYISAHARYFDNKNLWKLQVMTKNLRFCLPSKIMWWSHLVFMTYWGMSCFTPA